MPARTLVRELTRRAFELRAAGKTTLRLKDVMRRLRKQWHSAAGLRLDDCDIDLLLLTGDCYVAGFTDVFDDCETSTLPPCDGLSWPRGLAMDGGRAPRPAQAR